MLLVDRKVIIEIPDYERLGLGFEVWTRPKRRETHWDRFLRAYCVVLLIVAAAFFSLAMMFPVPWPRSMLGQIVLALIAGLIGARAMASMMARVGGRMVLEEFLGPSRASEVPGGPPGTVMLQITLGERLADKAERSEPLLPPRAVDAIYGVAIGVFGVILVVVGAALFLRTLYFLLRSL
jgi:hypothetical protein